METIFTQEPINKRCPFIQEEEEFERRTPRLRDLDTFMGPLQREQRNVKGRFPKKCTKTNRFLDFLRRQQQQYRVESDEEENLDFIQPRQTRQLRQTQQRCQQWGQQQQEPRMWYTVVPLQAPVRAEEVKVKLNPVCHLLVIKATPLMRKSCQQFRGINSTEQQIHRLVTLPKTIRMEKIQVKLNPRGELVIMAPYKSQQLAGRHTENLLPPFFQEEERDTQQWITIPINKLQGQRNICNKFGKSCRGFRGGEQWSETSSSSSSSSSSSESETETETESEDERLNFRRFGTKYHTESHSETETETETETDTDSECESENEMLQGRHQIIMEQLERINIRTSTKIQVKKFVQLLEKIFYPNIVLVKLLPGNTQRQQQTKKTLQVVVNIKFVDFKSEEIKVRMHQAQPVLIVEGKKVRQMSQYGAALKYVRREIQLPQVFNVKKVVYRVLENGMIQIHLPFLTGVTLRQQQQPRQGCEQRGELMANFCARRERCPHMVNFISEENAMRGKRCQERRNWKVLTQRCRPTRRC